MFNDYKEEVILAYQKKRETGDISMNLLHPTPGKLRAECVIVYKERFIRTDENIIKAFFGSKGDSADYIQLIIQLETDKFRPLNNFLNRKTNDSDEKNIHLLAWLINFEPRPYQSIYGYKAEVKVESNLQSFDTIDKTEDKQGMIPAIKPDLENAAVENKSAVAEAKQPVLAPEQKYSVENKSTIAEAKQQALTPEQKYSVENKSAIAEGKQPDNQTESSRVKEVDVYKGIKNISIKGVDASAGGQKTENTKEIKTLIKTFQPTISKVNNWKRILSEPKIKQIIASFMILIFASSGTYLFVSNINQQCMYWTGDHYEPVSCNQKIKDVAIIAMDTIKVERLKKITRPDTLTQSAVGKVWYTKIDNELEFYTSSGFHPVYTDRRLKPITAYIIDKYIKNDNIALQNQ